MILKSLDISSEYLQQVSLQAPKITSLEIERNTKECGVLLVLATTDLTGMWLM